MAKKAKRSEREIRLAAFEALRKEHPALWKAAAKQYGLGDDGGLDSVCGVERQALPKVAGAPDVFLLATGSGDDGGYGGASLLAVSNFKATSVAQGLGGGGEAKAHALRRKEPGPAAALVEVDFGEGVTLTLWTA